MLIAAIIFYVVVCFMSSWDFLWPLRTMGPQAGYGDTILTLIWLIILCTGLFG